MFSFIMSVFMVISLLPSISLKVYGLEKGSDNYYLIKDYEDLKEFARKVNEEGETTANARLENDIIANDGTFDNAGNFTKSDGSSGVSEQWTPIGKDASNKYTGTFDGGNHTIKGLYIDSTVDDYVGLFGSVGSGGTIKNVGMIDGYIKGNGYVGGVCGWNSAGTIGACYNTGPISGTNCVGGVCGWNVRGTIGACYNTGPISGSGNEVGGVCGNNSSGGIQNCYNTGTVTGSDEVGGVCGYNWDGTIETCYNTGTVTGTNYVGGVCGQNIGGTIETCYNTGPVSGSGNEVGGVCGFNNNRGGIQNCYNTGPVTGQGVNVGGVCGQNKGTIKNCYYDKTVCKVTVVIGSGTDDPSVTGLTTTQMTGKNESGRAKESMGGFAETIWKFSEDKDGKRYYPHLVGFSTEPQIAYDMYIYTKDDLKTFSDNVNAGGSNLCAKVTNDIVWNDGTFDTDGNFTKSDGSRGAPEQWIPIYGYDGTFDGGNHTIKGLYINSESDQVGFFCSVRPEGMIKNVVVEDGYIKGLDSVGGVCGGNYGGTIQNCHNTGIISGINNVGGVCGDNRKTIQNCVNTGTVTGKKNYVGGVCGGNYGETIENCYNTGTVTGKENYVGGVCGYNGKIIQNCYNTGDRKSVV